MKTFECKKPKNVAEEALWLAWQACSGASGMGIFQAASGATKEDVVRNVSISGDYSISYARSKKEIYADYVFGRMMKFRCVIEKKGLSYSDSAPTSDYQSWCVVYPTYEILFQKAEAVLAEAQAVA